MNYGAISYIIANEIANAYDTYNVQIDATTKVHKWWQPQAEIEYLKRVECMDEQYRHQVVRGRKIDVQYTQPENIADVLGARMGYLVSFFCCNLINFLNMEFFFFKAYKKYMEDHPEQIYLPGLSYSPDQLYYINMALVHCARTTQKSFDLLSVRSVDSPSVLRVNIPLQMSEDFARVYNCPENSPMNPPKKCSVL